MLNTVATAEYLQYESVKFSKSNNVGVFGQNARDTGVPSEVWRYYLLATRPESSDSQFTWTDFINKANAELLNNFGNFVNRVVKFCNARFAGVVPDPLSFPEHGNDPAPKPREHDDVGDREAFAPVDQVFVTEIDDLLGQYLDAMESLKLRLGLQLVMFTSARGNQYLQENGLNNALFASSPRRCAEVVRNALNLVYLLSAMVQPFMPTTSAQILKQLDAPPMRIPKRFGIDLLPGHKLADALYLFRKIEPEKATVWRKQYGGNKPVDAAAAPLNAAAPAGGAATGTGTGGGAAAAKEKKAKKASSKGAAATADVPAYTGPKTPELLELEKRVAEQGVRVRDAKAGKLEGGGSTGEEVAKLLALKKDLAELVTSLSRALLRLLAIVEKRLMCGRNAQRSK